MARADEDRLAPVKRELRQEYADVQHVTIEQYLAEHRDSVLVDVRENREFEVSRIPGALHAPDRDALLDLAQQYPDRELVLYCSVGRRSSAAARFLQSEGFDNVVNLEGSIFEWANDGRTMNNANGDTEKVHPYNFFWGWRYLSKEVRSK